jgi:competence protein ComEC
MKKLWIFVILCMLLSIWAAAESFTVRFIDVGQGDCTIIQTDGHTLVIDLGPVGAQDELEREFLDCEITEIDLLVLTHPHTDHDGNFEWVAENYPIQLLWMPEYADDEEDYGDLLREVVSKGTQIRYPNVGRSICIGDAAITCLSAEDTSLFDNKNLWSIVVKVEFGTTSVLVMGDAEDINEYRMIDAGMDLKADVLRIGHHGSDTGTTEAFLEAVQPSYAVISCGADNQYGHPDEAVLEALERYGVEVLRTENGTVQMESDGHGYIFTQDKSD